MEPLSKILRSAFLVCEIGAWAGNSTYFLGERSSSVITIDPWANSEQEYREICEIPDHLVWGPEVALLPTIYNQFLRRCWNLRTKILPLKTTSKFGLPLIAQAGIGPDLVYIDGEHFYNAVVQDIHLVLSLFPSAICCGDDWHWPEVQKAVRFCAGGRQIFVEGNFWRYT
jgi:hypothetical protein